MYIVGLRDGAALVVDGMAAPDGVRLEPESGTLAGPADAMAWVTDAVAAGVTFDVLKGIAAGLVRRGWAWAPRTADADAVTTTVRRYLESNGYVDITITDIRRVADAGWSLYGTADGIGFRAVASRGGEVTHVRVR